MTSLTAREGQRRDRKPDPSTSSALHKKARPPPPPPKKKPALGSNDESHSTLELADNKQHQSVDGLRTPPNRAPNGNLDHIIDESQLAQDTNAASLEQGDHSHNIATVPATILQAQAAEPGDPSLEVEVPVTADTSTSTASTTVKQQGDQSEDQQLTVTRVGRPITEDGKKVIVDEANWIPFTPLASVEQFAILIQKDDRRDRITFLSPYLQKVFRNVVKYFPEVVIDNKTLSFTEPYAPLYFYLDDMVRYVQDDKDLEAKPEDMDVLMYFYNKWVATYHTKVRETLAQGSAIFEYLWALYKPGDCIYELDEFDQPRLHIIAATAYKSRSQGLKAEIGDLLPQLPNINTSAGKFAMDTWYTDWDTPTQKFTRKRKHKVVQSFSGTRSITSLDFYPLKYYRDGAKEAADSLLSTLENRGYYWKELISEPSSCLYHDGPAKELKMGVFKTLKKEKTHLGERVLVDQEGFGMFPPPEGKAFSLLSDMMGPVGEFVESILGDESVGGDMDSLFSHLDSVPPSKPFTPLQAQLCPSTINCCVLSTMKWYSISVANLRDVEWVKEALEHLVLDQSIKDMLKGLVEEHKKNKKLKRIMSDVIPSKGQGLIMVLHGPPGVGKTLTAESVAEYTEKPLFTINIGELTAEQDVVQRLKEIFSQASRWDAVLLLDEADVVLEKRSYEDIRRNGVVSVFLRMLEYYEGILFLTTNRLGTMDIAFQSRISIGIKYRELDSDFRKKIWTNFIGRLDDYESEAKVELRANIDTLAAWELNGRQIRNILTIAQSIALAQGRRRGALRFSHVERVASETLNFQDFFDEAAHVSKQQLVEIGGDRRDKQFKQKVPLSR